MARQHTVPSEQDRRQFVEKMVQFRADLAPAEQQMFDMVLLRAVASGDEHGVQGYGVLDGMEHLGSRLVGLLEEWASYTVPVDEEGNPILYGTPGL
jgi:hypothetical protein